MATVASFNVALVASTGRFVSGISRAERQWNQFAKSVQRQAKTLPKSIQSAVPASLALGRNVAKIGAVAGIALSGLAAWGVKLAAQWEQTQIAFTTLLGSADAANKFLGQLVEFAARTPFNLTNIAQASRQLLAYGFAAEQVLPTLSAIGDAVAALGGDADEIQRAVLAIGQMQAKGKAAGEEMRQLTELGIPAWEMLAESIGVSVPEAMKLVEKRAIDASTGIAAMLEGINRRFAGAMEVQSKTLLGRLSTLRDNVEIILRGLGQDILRLTRLGERIDRLTEAISRFAAAVTEHGFIGALARAFPPWVQAVIVGITGAIVGGLVPAIIAWLIPALKKLGVSLWATLRPLLPWMAVGAAAAVTAYLLARAWGHLGDVARAVWSAIGAVALYGASLVVRGVGLILAGIGVIVPAFRGAAQAVLGLADSLKASASQSLASARSAAKMVRTAQQAQAGQQGIAQAGQKAAESQNQLAEGTEAAAKAAADNLQSFDEVHQIQEEMAESPAATMPEMSAYDLGAALPGVGGIGAALGEQLGGVADAAASAWNRLRAAMEPVNQAVKWIRDNWPTIGPIIEGIASVISVILIPALIDSGVKALKAAGQVAAAWAMQAVEAGKAVIALAGHALAVVGHWIWMGLQAAWNALKIVAAWAMQGIAAAGAVIATVANAAIIVGQWIWMGIQAMANAVKMAAAWFIALGPIAWVTAAVIAIAILVIAKWDWIKEKTVEIWGIVAAWLSDKWEWIKGIADAAWQWIKDHIIIHIQAAWDWLVATWDSIGNWLSEKWEWIKTTAGTIWDSIKTNIMNPIQTAWTWLETTWGNIVGFLSRTWDGIKETAKRAWDKVKDVIKGAINGIIGIINKLIDAWNSLKFEVPRVNLGPLGSFGGWTIGVPQIPKIPLLAEGGLVTAPTLAMVGERGPEAVVPLSRDNALADSIAQAVYQAVVDGFRITQTTQQQGDREVVLRIDGATFARLILPAVIKEGQRQGLQMVVRPQEA